MIEGEHGGKIVAVAVSGPGRPAARTAAELLISGHRPRIIIAAGFAGALNPSFSRNDLILPDEIIDREGVRHLVDKPASLGATDPARAAAGCLPWIRSSSRRAEKAELRAAHQADLGRHGNLGGGGGVSAKSGAVPLGPRHQRRCSHRPATRGRLGDRARQRSYRVGAALRAVWQRPSSIKDFWRLYEHAIEAAGRLGKFVSLCLDELEI